MQAKTAVPEDKQILHVLCYDLYYLVKDIVMKYSKKQEEKTIIQEEEVLIRSVYREFFDSDIFSDFEMLYKDDFYVISQIQGILPNDTQSFLTAVGSITKFLSTEDNKQKIDQICNKYKTKSKSEYIFRQAIMKVNTYTSQMESSECEKARQVLMELMEKILEFQCKTQ